MREIPRSRKLWVALVAMVALVLTSGLQAEEKKKKKKKRKKEVVEEVSPKKALRQADRELWAWATADARAVLEPVLDESDPDHLSTLGRVLAQEKSYGDALDRLRKACELAPADPAPWIEIGEVHLMADREAEADAAFAQASELAKARLAAAPEDSWSHYHLGVAEQRLKRFDQAVTHLERARELDPGERLVLYQLGATRAFRQEWQPAVDLLSAALELDGGLAYAYYYRGLSYGRLGRKDLMVNDLDRFLALAPESPDARRAQRLLDAAR